MNPWMLHIVQCGECLYPALFAEAWKLCGSRKRALAPVRFVLMPVAYGCQARLQRLKVFWGQAEESSTRMFCDPCEKSIYLLGLTVT